MAVTKPLVFITGATQGIGRAAARSLARDHSYHVLIGARRVEDGDKIANELRSQGHAATTVQIDLSSEASVNGAIATIERDFGYLDVLVNNAGILFDRRPELTKWDLYTQTFATNIIGTATLTEGLLPLLRKARSGPPRLVFVSSLMGSLAMSKDKSTPWYPVDYKAYDASKAAVNMLALNFARELDQDGGKSNAICPGYINSNLTGYDSNGQTPEEGASHIVTMATLGADGPTATFSNSQGPIPF